MTWENLEIDNVVDEFKGDYAFLSNFYELELPIRVSWGLHIAERWVNTTEHAYQAGKATLLEDFETVCGAPSPGEAKRLARKVQVRSDWEQRKVAHMLSVLRLKFKGDAQLGGALLDTGSALLTEGNKWGDTFWGVTLNDGRGENYLGRLLMLVREELRVARAAAELTGNQKPYW